MQITDGQNVKKAMIPRPIGFGFESGHNPILARIMMNNRGPEPSINIPQPILLSSKSKYLSFLMADT